MYPVHMREEVHAMLVALGDGGTVELAERALAHADAYHYPNVTIGGLAEVAEHLGCSKAEIGHWLAGRRPAPEWFVLPTWNIAAGPVWDMTDFPMRGSKTQ